MFGDMENEANQKALNVLCVRLVFCLYAEDAEIFGRKDQFHDYLEQYGTKDMRRALIELFKVLNTPEKERDQFLEQELAEFPYVNGGLFDDDNPIIPPFTDETRALLIDRASMDFDWSDISPTIFGAVFESTLNPETRRKGGMHYTSVENIHKVIDPLFMDDLEKEYEEVLETKQSKTRIQKLDGFQNKLAGLKFLDPACGSGNFLTETYLSLRKLENEILKEKEAARKGSVAGQISFGDLGKDTENPIKVSIQQFYGIEINDFACTVAKTALWIAESQMLKQTEDVLHLNLDFLPLKSYVNIAEGNALRIDWNNVISANQLDYIMGNPPFIGTRMMSAENKADIKCVLSSWKNYGSLDYVAAWYKKAADIMLENERIKTAFVSTNSISQGEQVSALWIPLANKGFTIDFAHKPFVWNSEAIDIAHVHCVIEGFSKCDETPKLLYDGYNIERTENISPYLQAAQTVFVKPLYTPISDRPSISVGCDFKDGNFLILDEEEYAEEVSKDPKAKALIRPYMMGRDFILRKPRYCYWLKGADVSLIAAVPILKERLRKVSEFRATCSSKATQRCSETPGIPVGLGCYSKGELGDVLAIPRISSQNRRYVPIEMLSREVIVGSSLCVIPSNDLFLFGILNSNVHNAWMRALCGRMKSDYRYSGTMVYNTLPWPGLNNQDEIRKTAKDILNARDLYPNASLADLYDPLTMPPELRKAHTENDKAVMAAYGFSTKMTEAECVAELMKIYQQLTESNK